MGGGRASQAGLGRPSELAFLRFQAEQGRSVQCISPMGRDPLSGGRLREPADVIAGQERPLVLHCRVEGEPPVSIFWHKDGAALGNDSHTAVLANGSLRIESFHHRPRGGGNANQTSVGDTAVLPRTVTGC
ncbi:unnamed protein product [Caretta caretta]